MGGAADGLVKPIEAQGLGTRINRIGCPRHPSPGQPPPSPISVLKSQPGVAASASRGLEGSSWGERDEPDWGWGGPRGKPAK